MYNTNATGYVGDVVEREIVGYRSLLEGHLKDISNDRLNKAFEEERRELQEATDMIYQIINGN